MDSAFFAVPSAQWGFASSPVIHDGKVIVLCDVLTNSFLAVFDLKSGKELWRTPRKDVPTWGCPAVVDTPGRKQIVVNGWHHSGGYDFATGKEIWKLDGGGEIPVPTPIFANGLIYLTSAHGRLRPMRAIRPEATGDITHPDPAGTNAGIAWVHPRQEKIGYRVTLVRLEGDKAVSYETFAEGWLQGERAWGRPVDVLVMPDGALLVSDDEAGAIYRISYPET